MHHVTMRMPTLAKINSIEQDGVVHVSLNIVPKSLELARSVGHEEAENDNIGIPACTSGTLRNFPAR